jgi:prepilin peptidase CpaA
MEFSGELMPLVLAGILIVILVVATFADLRTRRIPNWLTFGAVLVGIAMQFFLAGFAGAGIALAGFFVGLACFLPSYLFGALGAGDVKLMAAAGCFLGPIPAVVAALASVIAGGLLALVRIAWRGGLPALGARYGAMVLNLLSTRRLVYLGPAQDEPAAERFPYALAIATGTLVSLTWMQ